MRVLIVEDDSDMAAALARGLRREGLAMDVARDGQEALVKSAVTSYDVVVLDRDLPVIHVLGRGVTEPTRLRLVVELTARNPHTDTTSVMTCEYDSVSLDAQTPLAVLDFQLQQGEPALPATTPTHTIRHAGCDTTSPKR